MIGTGKYKLPGIRKAGALGLKALLAGFSWGAGLLAGPLGPLINAGLDWLAEFLANKGIVLLNLSVIVLDKKVDGDALLRALEDGLLKAEKPGLTKEEGRAIDDAVKKAFRRAVHYNRT